GVMNVGHAHPEVVEAIKRQAEKLLHYSNTDFYYEESVKFAEKLVSIAPGNFGKKVFFSNSGTESVEAAIKLARWRTKRQYVIGFIGAFHGRTYGSLSITSSKPVQRAGFSPLVPGIVHVPYPYSYRCPFGASPDDPEECANRTIAFIEDWVFGKFVPPEEVAAFIFEPSQGEGGYIVPPENFIPQLRKLANEHGILLIDDEVQAGMGRTGKWWAIQHFGVDPDILTSAKALGGGLPIGATIAREDVMTWPGGSHASTFGGNPVSCASGLATINVIEREKLVERAAALGDKVMKLLNEWKEKYEIVGDVRGKGLMIGIEIVKDKTSRKKAPDLAQEIMMRAWKSGVAIITAGVNALRIFPPLNIEEEYLFKALEIVEDKIREVS
ncbi:MAG: acetyl ornithine aminotransferase family protein, partial [Candidatus Korarchaeota archaeon]|nr:acetyl ornithine aminotransferase family protein [Candidatus Korarchaeota archaeon]